MRILFGAALVGIVLGLSSGVALAGEGCGAMDVVAHIFEMSDTDDDGALTRAEFAAAGLERYGVPFEDYDANGDGRATFDEYRALYDRHHPAPGEVRS